MSRIHTHEQHLLAPRLCPVPGDFLRVGQVVVDGDEGAADVGLLVEVREAEAGQRGCVVQDGGVVFRAEAGAERVPRLGAGAVDAVHKGRDGGGWGRCLGSGLGEGMGGVGVEGCCCGGG